MFEQTLLASAPRKNAAVFAVSLSAQVLGIGTMLLIPLIYTNRLAFTPPTLPLFLALTPPPPVEVKEAPARPLNPSQTSIVVARPVRLPTLQIPGLQRPVGVPLIGDLPPDIGPVGLFGPGIPFLGLEHMARVELPVPTPPKPQTVEVDKPVQLTSTILSSKIIRKITPVYPRLAVITRVSGTVHLMGIIAKDGSIQNLQVVSGHPLLVAAAVEAVKQWLYSPTILNGKPVEVIAPIEVVFTLGQ